jgi:CHAT domain-containing protein
MSDEFDIIQKELEAYKKEKEEAEKKHKEELEKAKKEAMELVKKEFEAKRLEEEKAKKEAILEAKVKDLETKSQVEIDALKSNSIASSNVKKNLVILLSVIVNGPPVLICSIKNGITDPFDPITLPPLIHTNLVKSDKSFACTIIFSPTAFVIP